MNNSEMKLWADEMLVKLRDKIPYSIANANENLPNDIPYTVKDGKWAAVRPGDICWWTNGFWPAAMLQMYSMTGDEAYLTEARRTENMLDDAFRNFYDLHHDVGFMWRISSGFDHQLTGDETNRKRAMLAANLLAGRFNPKGFIRAWNGDRTGWAIIDCMMNLSVLYWASEQTSDPRFRIVAERHADTTLKNFIRPNGTSEHIVVFDPETGDVLDKLGGQGYEAGSAWSRGQSWAINGFAISYRHTQKPEYLAASRKVADMFIAAAEKTDWLANCDFICPETPVIKDDCANGIAACGMLELADILGDEGACYREAAFNLLKALADNHADWSHDYPAILNHCTAAYHSDDRHIAMNYGDYFFIEGVNRLRGDYKLRW